MTGFRTLVLWKFGSTITKNVRSLSQSLLVSMQKANELTSSAPRTSNWRPARAGAAPTMPKAPSELVAPASAPKVLKTHHKTALCSTLPETLTLCAHSYCKQTLHHCKLRSALDGSLLGSSRPGLASRRPRRDFRVTCSSSERARPSHIGVLEVSVSHHENRPIAPT